MKEGKGFCEFCSAKQRDSTVKSKTPKDALNLLIAIKDKCLRFREEWYEDFKMSKL